MIAKIVALTVYWLTMPKKNTAPSLTLSKRINRMTRCQRHILCPAPTTTSTIMFFA
jgi:hypothetical protein